MRTERPRWLLLVALLLLLAYLIYMTGFPIPRQETATERCERVSTEQVVHDNLVSPQDTSRLAWARNLAVAGVGHVSIIATPATFALVLEGAGWETA